MSEFEIRKRQEYKRNRKKWSIIQIVAIVIVACLALGSFLIYDRMNRTYYIEYSENSSIDYKVQYKENDFFGEEWIEKDQAYIVSLIESIAADFDYKLNMDANNVSFDYEYSINAALIIADKDTGAHYYMSEEELLPSVTASTRNRSRVQIAEQVNIDYNKYNAVAKSFINTYGLKNASSTLVVTLNVEVISTSEQFEQENSNKYSTALNIPLAVDTISMHITSSVPASESKVLAYQAGVNQDLFLITGIVSSVIAAILGCVLAVFLHLTRNEDITYVARVRKLLNAYSSYIQRMDGEFEYEGYQPVMIKSFTEMLGIRDTIQSPILMTENRDETMTRFLIPTNTQLLYIYEIKVDNYDEIYAKYEEAEPETEPEEQPELEEAVILDEAVDAEAIAEAMAEPDVVLSDIDYEITDDAEFEVSEDQEGVEIIGVVWPERTRKNKVYRYDPNGETLHEGDMVLVPTRDAARDKEVVRKAAVAQGNIRVDPGYINHPLKKIIGVIKRKAEAALTSGVTEEDNK